MSGLVGQIGKWVRTVIESVIRFGYLLRSITLRLGAVGLNPAGREIGYAPSLKWEMTIFDGLPQQFSVIQTVDMVLTRPTHATEIAHNDMGAMAMAIGDHVRTVQWHPEFDGDVIRHYIRVRADLIDAEMGHGAAKDIESKVTDVNSASDCT